MVATKLGRLVKERTIMLSVEHHSFGNSRQASLKNVNIAPDAQGHETDTKMVSLMKTLIDSPELDAIQKFDGETCAIMRQYGFSSKLRPGVYTIGKDAIGRVEAILQERARRRAELVSVAVEAYPARVAEAATKLGVKYDANDYISQRDFSDRFSMVRQWIGVEVPSILHQEHPELALAAEEQQAALREQLAEEMRETQRETMRDLVVWFRNMLEPTEDGKRKRFYGTAITHLQEFCELFGLKNVTEDGDLQALVAEAEALVRGMDEDAFREKGSAADAYRSEVKDQLAALQEKLEPLVTTVKTRKILLDRPAA